MKFSRLAIGVGVGFVTGFTTAILNTDRSGDALKTDLKSTADGSKIQLNEIKDNAIEIKDYVLKTKDESQIAIQSLSEEIKTMINEFKADINPNIEQIQKNIENISNRGNEIQKEIQNTKLPFLKN
ncbi:YtxH domain-containing protein [Mammaliicoccus sciuri]|uniref:YtxH domain-containing protein n=1 Tax=Mammaliicoccus sciuri TaxID=1296 RepID=UPI0008076E23|nr:YtxH domain-containing protein [Mammaliicoccus sciuri]MBO1208132.1 YtxH domain-containing protein [Mammaliicoccus sciuri]MEB5675479.1 YtxH domain-containing protein [Mammaliicoccus sciuri]MEB6123258.1 YtxH domain-containing protein [Mammaliicoccus sciuri]MEB6253061.1 YtxH domain-containing protein [Mammaliicoccus sciuri]MEB6313594.1 YtxH domain-containing protein [Mammaliicoccus sciuri]